MIAWMGFILQKQEVEAWLLKAVRVHDGNKHKQEYKT